MKIFYGLMCFIIGQRILELLIARRNEIWMKARGGIELGESHYKWFIILHSSFFLALIAEFQYRYGDLSISSHFHLSFFIIFLLAQCLRIWCMVTLGPFWNTKVIVLPKVARIRKGPYKYLRHPNYVIVFIELLAIPLIFNLFFVATLFPFFHLLLLTIRIPIEDQALEENSMID